MTDPVGPDPGLRQPGRAENDDDALRTVEAELQEVVAEAQAESDALVALAAERDDYLDSLTGGT